MMQIERYRRELIQNLIISRMFQSSLMEGSIISNLSDWPFQVPELIQDRYIR